MAQGCTLLWNATQSSSKTACTSNIPVLTLDLGAISTGGTELNQTMPDGLNQLATVLTTSTQLNFTLPPYKRVAFKLINSGSKAVQVQIPGTNNFKSSFSWDNSIFYASNLTYEV